MRDFKMLVERDRGHLVNQIMRLTNIVMLLATSRESSVLPPFSPHFEFDHCDNLSAGQKSHGVNATSGHRNVFGYCLRAWTCGHACACVVRVCVSVCLDVCVVACVGSCFQ